MTIEKTYDEKFIIKLHDNSGGIERTLQAMNGFIGKIKFFRRWLNLEPLQMSLQITVPATTLYANGIQYFKGVISRSSAEQQDIDQFAASNALKDISGLEKTLLSFAKKSSSWLQHQLNHYYLSRPKQEKWKKTIEAFGAISPEQIEFIPSMRTPAEAGVCYAQRMQTNQIDALGEKLYTKFGCFVNEWCMKKIIDKYAVGREEQIMSHLVLENEKQNNLKSLKELANEAKKIVSEEIEKITRNENVILTPDEIKNESFNLISLSKDDLIKEGNEQF